MAKRRTISPNVHLQALALFTMANRHYLKASQFGKELAGLLKFDDDWAGKLGDAWLDENPDFEGALEAEGFVVRKRKKRAKS